MDHALHEKTNSIFFLRNHFNCSSFKACEAWKKEAEKQERLLKQVEEERDYAVKIRDNVSQQFHPLTYFLVFHCHCRGRLTFKQARFIW